jgi:hypothetical protein
MKKVNLCAFSDLLFCAKKIGFNWNQAHDILVKDEVPPMYELNSKEIYKSECSIEANKHCCGYSEDTLKILNAFFKQENVTEFTLVND